MSLDSRYILFCICSQVSSTIPVRRRKSLASVRRRRFIKDPLVVPYHVLLPLRRFYMPVWRWEYARAREERDQGQNNRRTALIFQEHSKAPLSCEGCYKSISLRLLVFNYRSFLIHYPLPSSTIMEWGLICCAISVAQVWRMSSSTLVR